MEAVRLLVERTTLPQHEIAARVGVCRATVSNLRTRHGWMRPGPARFRGQRAGDPMLVAAIEAARALVEGTALSMTAIGARIGVSRTALCRWRKARGWRRPPGAPTFLPGPRADGRARPTRYRTARGRPYAADAVGQAKTLLTTTLLSQAEIARRLGVSQGWVGSLLRRRGWERPPVPLRSKRFAGASRTGLLKQEGDRRGRPYAAEVRREARALFELTRLSTGMNGAKLGAHRVTVARWAKEGEWVRPRGRAGRAQLRGFFGAVLRG